MPLTTDNRRPRTLSYDQAHHRRQNRTPPVAARRANPRARRRDGDADPGPRLRRADRPRRALRHAPQGPQELCRHPLPDAPRCDPRDPPPLLRGRGRHRRDEHLRREPARHGGIRSAGRTGAGHQPRGGGACLPGPRRVHGEDARSAAVRRRLDRPDDQADRDQHPGRRRQLSRRDVRPDGRFVLCPGGGAGRSGRRHSAPRNGDRHAQPQGLPVRHRKVFQRERRADPRDGLRHVRPRRGDVCLRPGRRSVLERDRPLPAAHGRHELCAGAGADAAGTRTAAGSLARLRQLPSERGAAQRDGRTTTSARPTWRRCSASLPSAAGSTSSAAAAAPTPDHIARDRRLGPPSQAPPAHDRRSPSAAQRHAAVHAPPRQQLHDDRRADQRHRLARSSPGSSRIREATKKPSKSPPSRSPAAPT